MTTEQQREEILGKVRKLISKRDSAEKIGNQAEADAFAAKITEMMAKYNIELFQLEKPDDQSTTTDAVIQRVNHERRHEGDWGSVLFNTLCKFNFCSCFLKGDFDGYKNIEGIIVIIGEPHNIATVKFMYEYLMNAGRELGRESYKSYNNPDIKRNSYLRGFYRGFGISIYQRLRQQEEQLHSKFEAEAQANINPNQIGNQYGLVVKSHFEKNQEYIANTLKVTLKREGKASRNLKDTTGLIDGRIAGNNINLNKQLNTNNQNPKGYL